MKNFFIIILFGILAISCKSTKNMVGLDRGLFILTPVEAVDFIQSQGFNASGAQLVYYKNRPAWIVDVGFDYILLEVWGHKYVIPQEYQFFKLPSHKPFKAFGEDFVILETPASQQYLKINY